MRILALDPGKNNFAFALLVDGRCRDHGHFRTVTDLHYLNVRDEVIRFTADLESVLTRADWLAFERMQHRPRMGGGAVVEFINLMLGICIERALQSNTAIYPVSSVTWKSAVRKRFGHDRDRFCIVTQKMSIKQPPGSKTKTKTELVRGVLADQPGAQNLSAHEGDAVGIGCYVHRQLTGIDVLDTVLC